MTYTGAAGQAAIDRLQHQIFVVRHEMSAMGRPDWLPGDYLWIRDGFDGSLVRRNRIPRAEAACGRFDLGSDKRRSLFAFLSSSMLIIRGSKASCAAAAELQFAGAFRALSPRGLASGPAHEICARAPPFPAPPTPGAGSDGAGRYPPYKCQCATMRLPSGSPWAAARSINATAVLLGSNNVVHGSSEVDRDCCEIATIGIGPHRPTEDAIICSNLGHN